MKHKLDECYSGLHESRWRATAHRLLQGPGPTAKVLDLQNGTNGRCRDSQRVLDELIEALEGDKEAGGGRGR